MKPQKPTRRRRRFRIIAPIIVIITLGAIGTYAALGTTQAKTASCDTSNSSSKGSGSAGVCNGYVQKMINTIAGGYAYGQVGPQTWTLMCGIGLNASYYWEQESLGTAQDPGCANQTIPATSSTSGSSRPASKSGSHSGSAGSSSSGAGGDGGSGGGGTTSADGYSCVITTGSCQSSSDPYSYSEIGGDATRPFVNTNPWGAGGTNFEQTLYSNSPGNWYVAASISGNTSGQVVAYPSATWTMPAEAIDSYQSIDTSWNVTIPTNSQTATGWAAYDLWFNDWKNEVMIQTDITASSDSNCQAENSSGNGLLANNLTIGGQSWHLCRYGTGTSDVELVIKPGPSDEAMRNEASGSLNILPILQWLESNGYLPQGSTWTNSTSGGFGFEICNTNGAVDDFRVNGFTWDSQE
jgi:hypothetical protein